MSSRLAVDGQRAVAALADARRTRCGRRCPACAANSSRWAATIRRQAPSQSAAITSPAAEALASLRRSACGPRGHASDWLARATLVRSLASVSPMEERPTGARTAPTEPRRASSATARVRCSSPARRARAAARRSPAGSRAWPTRARSPQYVLVLTRSRAARGAAARARRRSGRPPYEELWIATYEAAAERLLREYALEAGLDPFFATVRLADRLAMLLDRLDDLSAAPPRDPRQPGGPARPPAAPDRRAEGRGRQPRPAARLGRASASASRRSRTAERERASREREFADLYASHDRILRECGSLDGGDLVIELGRAARASAPTSARERVAAASSFVMVDELEDAGAAHRALIDALAPSTATSSARATPTRRSAVPRWPSRTRRRRSRALPGRRAVILDRPLRFGARRQRVRGRLAMARVAASDARDRSACRHDGDAEPASGARRSYRRCVSLLALRDRARRGAGGRPGDRAPARRRARCGRRRICVIVGSGWREARLVAAALEERTSPSGSPGDAALFQRPEVRDVLAWLRMLADPTDSAAVVRALTRPPVELRSVDLARCTTIARRRKLDMVSALEAALESPQLPPEARDRIQAFLQAPRARPPARSRRCGPTSSSAA